MCTLDEWAEQDLTSPVLMPSRSCRPDSPEGGLGPRVGGVLFSVSAAQQVHALGKSVKSPK